ncbi:hypothetical protein PHYPSEUDO_008436 [Phytophthora pseudosyringae]|uniref:Ankyrin repeat protein n=1 Tax=Phytophthora pseudosyringae TaxID=221518 RepID=A0A8T1VET5_9STRA|nr:hypothetical protein PHYPSEUDO_008436 [Phytophthora pseudosyringae]
MASVNGHVSIAEFLLEHDVPVDATASNGSTSLMGAAMAYSGRMSKPRQNVKLHFKSVAFVSAPMITFPPGTPASDTALK